LSGALSFFSRTAARASLDGEVGWILTPLQEQIDGSVNASALYSFSDEGLKFFARLVGESLDHPFEIKPTQVGLFTRLLGFQVRFGTPRPMPVP
jgi:hypothetical protein